MLHLGGGIPLGVDIRNLLEFQRPFESHREVVATTEVKRIAGILELDGHLPDGVVLLQNPGYLLRHFHKFAQIEMHFLLRHGAPLAQGKRQHEQYDHLGGKRLG